MEIEGSSPVVAKKLWSIMRLMFFMLRKGIAKSKIMADFNLLLKRGKKALLNNHHYYMPFFTFRSHGNANTFISPRDYEFSCSNSPAIPFKRRNNRPLSAPSIPFNTNSPFPAFRNSPIGKQLRVTDSPFPLTDQGDTDTYVDVAAEQFIQNFYKDLYLQRKMAPLESPYHTCWNR
ncbi:uncharacterized protein LOC109804287 [Cajanus cajan]|uniref:Uncharacterized protein n=1 Tax=Cajanus cajan TaxID=3821 RepID=A0A151T3P9_CAJCA|nr:uncharacterized protein LOC109804287 [Cajanus cajan]KYP61659.1 hypothetical protein KK1_016167 [Cajanus cajan]